MKDETSQALEILDPPKIDAVRRALQRLERAETDIGRAVKRHRYSKDPINLMYEVEDLLHICSSIYV